MFIIFYQSYCYNLFSNSGLFYFYIFSLLNSLKIPDEIITPKLAINPTRQFLGNMKPTFWLACELKKRCSNLSWKSGYQRSSPKIHSTEWWLEGVSPETGRAEKNSKPGRSDPKDPCKCGAKVATTRCRRVLTADKDTGTRFAKLGLTAPQSIQKHTGDFSGRSRPGRRWSRVGAW